MDAAPVLTVSQIVTAGIVAGAVLKVLDLLRHYLDLWFAKRKLEDLDKDRDDGSECEQTKIMRSMAGSIEKLVEEQRQTNTALCLHRKIDRERYEQLVRQLDRMERRMEGSA